jgi:hypothetical protein
MGSIVAGHQVFGQDVVVRDGESGGESVDFILYTPYSSTAREPLHLLYAICTHGLSVRYLLFPNRKIIVSK